MTLLLACHIFVVILLIIEVGLLLYIRMQKKQMEKERNQFASYLHTLDKENRILKNKLSGLAKNKASPQT